MTVPRLLEISFQALSRGLHFTGKSSEELRTCLSSIPEPELAQAVWQLYQDQLAAHPTAAPWSHHHAVALAFAQAFWQPARLELRELPDEAYALQCLPAVSSALQHLALALQATRPSLSSLAACPQLRCLCLRGSRGLEDGSFEALVGCTTLQALDCSGLAQLTDAAALHWSRLPALSAVNATHTSVGDKALELITYGHRLRAWAQQSPIPPPPEVAARWPALPLAQLRLAATRVTDTGLGWLRDLPSLTLLDVRWTGLTRGVLVPLQQRFGLQLVQGAVLSSSNALVAAVVNHDAVACACQPVGPKSPTQEWAVQGARLLLYACPSRGNAGFLSQEPQPGQAAEPGQPSGEVPSLLRRQGYRDTAGRQAKRGRHWMGSGVAQPPAGPARGRPAGAVGSSIAEPRAPWPQPWPPPQHSEMSWHWAPPQPQASQQLLGSAGTHTQQSLQQQQQHWAQGQDLPSTPGAPPTQPPPAWSWRNWQC